MLQHFDRPTLERRVRSGFEYKGRFTPAMRAVPVETISHPHVELLALQDCCSSHEASGFRNFVLFGATGDLSQRMVWPSLYHLCREKPRFRPRSHSLARRAIRTPTPSSANSWKAAVRKHVPAEYLKDDAVADLLTRITYAPFEAGDGSAKGTEALQKALAGNNRILYFMATSPKLYGPTCLSLPRRVSPASSVASCSRKPIGQDYASSVGINEAVGQVFHEDRIFRIDHYLGKEAVQNLLALRFANSLFEPLWNASAIDNVQITVAETVGLEGRTGYYDESGALRDMVQNHMLQLVALVAMEPPHLFEPNEVRNREDQGHAQPASVLRGHGRR